jgi:hypothetical protein
MNVESTSDWPGLGWKRALSTWLSLKLVGILIQTEVEVERMVLKIELKFWEF